MKKTIIIIFQLIFITILSCSEKDTTGQIQNSILDADESSNILKDFLKSLPKDEAKSSRSPGTELSMFLKGRDAVMSKNYREGFESLAEFLYLYPSSYYESEAAYLLGKSVIYMLGSDPLYIKEFYLNLSKQTSEYDTEEFSNDSTLGNFSIDDIYNQLGITVSDEEDLSFNGAPFSRIVNEDDSIFLLKDFAYYYSIRHRFSKIETENDKERFNTNVMLMQALSDRYRTSVLQSVLFNDKSYFPDTLPFTLDRSEKKDYNEMYDTVGDRIDKIKPEKREYAYVNGNGIIVRDRMALLKAGTEKKLITLNNYNFVTILRSEDVYNTRKREDENWVLVEYDTFYGPLVGWAYGKYFTNDTALTDVFSDFRDAMKLYDSYYYIEASHIFSSILSLKSTNYFTDKSAYFLWRVNNKIGELVSLKNNVYYDYVCLYPKYFYYNTNTSVLHSSTLLYNYIIKIMPDSPYKFRISGDSETVYNID